MMHGLVQLANFWHNNKQLQLCLCTVVKKTELAPCAIGRKKIVELKDSSCGSLTESSIENDINTVARSNWDKMPFVRTFSLSFEDLAIKNFIFDGCSGTIDVLFEPLPSNADIKLYFPHGVPPIAKGVSVQLSNAKSTNRTFADNIANQNDFFFDPWSEAAETAWL